MELQSRFGTDERFRMDSRFLEDEDEEEDNEAESGGALLCSGVDGGWMNFLLRFLLSWDERLISATQRGKGTLRRRRRF